jgi:hypothetical protein
MKRLAVALVAVFALAAGAEAGSIFTPDHLAYHLHAYHATHYVRGPVKGKKHGGSSKAQAEARQTPQPAPQKPAPQPVRAD